MKRATLVVVVLVGVAVATLLVLRSTGTNNNAAPNSSSSDSGQIELAEPKTKAEALEQARTYTPPSDRRCQQQITAARHTATGAEKSFSTSCLPPGWEVVQ